MLPGLVVKPGTIVVFKRLLDKYMDMEQVLAEEIGLTWHHVWHGHGGPKGLFLCAVVYINQYSATWHCFILIFRDTAWNHWD